MRMSTSEQNNVVYDVKDGVARITLNRPEKRNALNNELVDELKDALRRADEDVTLRAVLLMGAGPDFCSGADLAALRKISGASVAENIDDAHSLLELFVHIRRVRVPVIAAVRGRALAGGCGLALACDLVVAASSARFGFPEVRIGFVPAMVMAILRRNLSEKKAFELIALGDEVNAETAERLGLINQVLGDEEFETEAQNLAARFNKLSRSAVALSKGLLYQMDGMAFEDALSSGADINTTARMTEDCKEGLARFLKKE